MVIDWLLNSLSKDIVESVIYSQTIEELWSELEKRYEQADGAKLFQLQRELNNISQGTNDVAAYFTRINRIWDQMKVLNTFMTCCCECICRAKTHNHRVNEDKKLIHFLWDSMRDILVTWGHSGVMTKTEGYRTWVLRSAHICAAAEGNYVPPNFEVRPQNGSMVRTIASAAVLQTFKVQRLRSLSEDNAMAILQPHEKSTVCTF